MLSEKLNSLSRAFRPGNPLGFSKGLPGDFMGNLADLLERYAEEALVIEVALAGGPNLDDPAHRASRALLETLNADTEKETAHDHR